MSNVLPFLARPSPGGDWTDIERTGLQSLAARLAPGVSVSTVFGATDAGDPWCVVTDENDEVLLHVARIGGRFVIHQAAQDVVRQGDTLWSAASQILQADRVGQRDGAVVNLRDREVQTLLAVVAGTEVSPEPAAGMSSPAASPAPTAYDDAAGANPAGGDAPAIVDTVHGETSATVRAAAAEPGDGAAALVARTTPISGDTTPPPAPAPNADAGPEAAQPQLQAPARIAAAAAGSMETPAFAHAEASSGRLVLNGGPGADTLTGGPGDDRLDGHGAPHGQVDLLNGGAGNDRLILHENTIAIGGPGADTFVVIAPKVSLSPGSAPPAADGGHLVAAEPSLGTVVDYNTQEGDHLEFVGGSQVAMTSKTAVTDVVSPALTGASFTFETPVPGVRVGLDFNGDGHEDGYVLLGGPDAAAFTVDSTTHAGAVAEVAPWHETVAAGHFTEGLALLG